MEKSIGALWLKKAKNGNKYISISLGERGQEERFVAFENKFKKTDQHPDFLVYKPQENKEKPEPIGNLENIISPEDLPF